MYVSKPSACHGNETYTFKHTRSELIDKAPKSETQEALHYVCMFENPLPVMENETYTLEHELENTT